MVSSPWLRSTVPIDAVTCRRQLVRTRDLHQRGRWTSKLVHVQTHTSSASGSLACSTSQNQAPDEGCPRRARSTEQPSDW
eukprot:6469623-Amphidinium_carterae.3